uniref:Carboxylic ester hydrolase n=1 Tax=Streltzoviella insularis TaxID=1206366 RepID=A0A7D5UMQ7_9NEOP|nr:carboxylesterase 3 [Streltzoviella insularis]
MYKLLSVCVFVCVVSAYAYKQQHAVNKGPTASPAPTVAASSPPTRGDGPVTVTPSGTIRGSWMETRKGRRFQAYRGIRYAEPPVGELRFQPPKMILNYKGEVDASEEGPACPLPAPETYYVDEDCLRINVYTPTNKSTKPLPVVFFLHPGGFYAMTGRSDLAGPHYLLDRDLVLVTINYRLATLGFLSTGDELAPGNNGMKDQVAALRWVQRNIAAFGGDPNLVTIAGCSAGSISVMLHMISPMSKGLFHRAISMSGSPMRKERATPRHERHLAVKQAQLVGCPTNSTRAIYDCLKTKPWRELGNSLSGFFEYAYDPVGIWLPVVELDFGQERFLSVEPFEAIKQGKMHPVPYIISQTEDEFFWFAFSILRNETLLKAMNTEWNRMAPISFMLPQENLETALTSLRKVYLNDKLLANDDVSARNLGRLYVDSIESFPVHRLANLMCRYSSQPVYYYLFSYIGNHSHYEDPTTGKPVGAAHHDDLIYLFTLSYRFPTIPLSSADDTIVERMTALWYTFAKHGDPNPRGDLPELTSLSWPPMKPDDRKYLRIDKEFSVHNNLAEDRVKVWEELYPIEY